MITDRKQLEVALSQLEGFKGMMEGMRRRLNETDPSLLPTVAESYQDRMLELQEEICDYLLRQRSREGNAGEPSAHAQD